MPRVPFDALPDHGRLWVFPVSRPLQPDERDRLLAEVDDFLANWAAHGQPLRSARDLVEDQFLVIGVDVDAEAPSGCSIDALVRRLGGVAEALDVTLRDQTSVRYRAGDEIRTVSRAGFRAAVERGEIGPDVHVFDTTLVKVEQLRAGGLEAPASSTWHGRAFFREQTQS
jgi:hypothetical protein